MTAEKTGGPKKPRARRATPKPAAPRVRRPRPDVSIVIPARNEEANLGPCLASLVTQPGVKAEIIVVDDHSTDRTAELARQFEGVKVVSADELRPGWSGKCNAMSCGAAEAKGKWLLFTDADTIHLPGSLARALAEAHDTGAELLSYSPAQEVESFWERAVMPVVFSELAETYPPREVCDPSSPAAAANGQYLLISREAYDAVGGYGACAGTLLEDVALARRVKQSGRNIRFRFGGDVVRTRMYQGFDELREGWTKNLALLFPDARRRSARRAAEFGLIVGAGLAAVVAAVRGERKTALTAAAIAGGAYVAFLRRVRKAHFGAVAEAASIAGLPVFAYLLARSERRYRTGRPIRWKGRDYESAPVESERADSAGMGI
jgi:glycosyltransferase involved in cell wall biosynthesis